jgi:hypothetical protein
VQVVAVSDIPKVETGGHWGDSETGYAYLAGELRRERDQARDLACEYASRLAEIERLLSEHVQRWAIAVNLDERHPMQQALAVASGAAVEVPLRVLVEWTLRGRGWETVHEWRDYWRPPWAPRKNAQTFWQTLDVAVRWQIEREEAAPAAEAST